MKNFLGDNLRDSTRKGWIVSFSARNEISKKKKKSCGLKVRDAQNPLAWPQKGFWKQNFAFFLRHNELKRNFLFEKLGVQLTEPKLSFKKIGILRIFYVYLEY